MAGRLKDILANARACYAVTKSPGQTLRFITARNSNDLLSIRLKDGTSVILRSNQTDKDVFLSTFYNGYHRINHPLGKAPVIVDLGSNIGLTIVDYLQQYRDAIILGVEMDEENYKLAKKNTATFPAVTLLNKAIWKENGTVVYSGRDAQSYGISGEGKQVAAIGLDNLLLHIPRVELMKMDIEGAEYAVLLDSHAKSWLRRVKYLNIEVHNTAEQDAATGMQKIIKELEAHQFEAVPSDNHWSSVIAVNKELA